MQEQLDRMIEDLNREIDIFLNAWSKTGVQREMKDLQMQLGNVKRQLSAIRLGEREARLNLQSVRMAQRSINNVQRMMRPSMLRPRPMWAINRTQGIAQRMGRIFQYVQSQSQPQPQQQNRFQQFSRQQQQPPVEKTPTPRSQPGNFSRSFSPFRTGVYNGDGTPTAQHVEDDLPEELGGGVEYQPNKTFTPQELARFYNGMGGRPAYIAAAGYVFDVTAHPSWRAGSHHGILAGQDVTDRLLENHPEGLQMLLENLPVVGRLRPSQKKGF